MSDADLSADNIRAMLTEANGRLRKASAEYFELLEKGLTFFAAPGRRPGQAVLQLPAAQCHCDV